MVLMLILSCNSKWNWLLLLSGWCYEAACSARIGLSNNWNINGSALESSTDFFVLHRPMSSSIYLIYCRKFSCVTTMEINKKAQYTVLTDCSHIQRTMLTFIYSHLINAQFQYVIHQEMNTIHGLSEWREFGFHFSTTVRVYKVLIWFLYWIFHYRSSLVELQLCMYSFVFDFIRKGDYMYDWIILYEHAIFDNNSKLIYFLDFSLDIPNQKNRYFHIHEVSGACMVSRIFIFFFPQ